MSTINIDGIVFTRREDGTYQTQLLGSLLLLRPADATLDEGVDPYLWVAELRTPCVALPPSVHKVSGCGSTQRRALHALRRGLFDASDDALRRAAPAHGQEMFAWLVLHHTLRGCAEVLRAVKHELEVPHG